MINQANYNLSLTRTEFKELAAIRPWEGEYWEEKTIPNNNIKAIKVKIRQQLEAAQNVCCYCGLKLGGTSNGEIEHIAPKSKHPEFTFSLKNLALACHLCNFPEKKGQKETIETKAKGYKKCEFLLVHPYFDEPNLHYEWTDNHIEILIQVRDDSPKGLFSINMFELDTPIMNELRAQHVRFEELKTKRPLSDANQELLDDALKHKSNSNP